MMPDHCKEVSLKKVGFQLTSENISKYIKGKKAYIRTRYYILENNDEYAVVEVEKKTGNDLFSEILAYKIISLPKNTVFVDDCTIDVNNRSQMSRLSEHYEGMTVVVKGMFNHVSFVKDESPVEIYVIDIVPPNPSKLLILAEKAVMTGLIDIPVLLKHEEIDLEIIGNNTPTQGVIFPCKASGISCNKVIYFLDDEPEIDVESTLVGCDLSMRIFKELYGTEINFINICPRNYIKTNGCFVLIKCCKVKKGFEMRGNAAVVPWGATLEEVAKAMSELAALARKRL